MAGRQDWSKETGRVGRLRRTARFAVLVLALPCYAATPAATVPATTAPQPKLAKPSAYHDVEPIPQAARPLPRPRPAPHPVAVKPTPVLHTAAPYRASRRPSPQHQFYSGAAVPVQPPTQNARPQPAQLPRNEVQLAQTQQQPRLPTPPSQGRLFTYPMPRPAPIVAEYPETAPPPYARRILYQGNPYPGNANQRREMNQSATEHLPAWIRKHQNESPAERERSLRQEPGFNRLAPGQQQNLINTLHRLNEMPPEQRERTLMRMENMERLSPQMRDAVRSSARQLNDMPPDRKRLWQRAFRDLRDMPPEQRQEILRSQEFASQFSAQERSIMGNLLAVEPYRNPGPMPPPLYGR